MRKFGWLALVLAGGLAISGSGLSSNGFDLRVNDVSGLDKPWPLVGGLPFPEGALRDTARLRMVDGAGREVPAQFDVVATWRDGSIRWALAGLTASPQEHFRVKFAAPQGVPGAPELVVTKDAGGMLIDTGAAVFDFRNDGLLPASVSMGGVNMVSASGDGAYLVDNRGRLARVAGAAAEIESVFLTRGTGRVVLRREGWYVTPEGERLARARIWFYISAGSPVLRLTHSLVLTEDTNELWVRDYGIEFRTPGAPRAATFALGETDKGQVIEALPGAGEAYLLQDTYPHFFQTGSRAVVALTEQPGLAALLTPEKPFAPFWSHDWVGAGKVAGDWADARFADHGMTLVMPHLSRRFPKELAVGAEGLRAAFWSGRSGRELDFRSATLVNEYWQDYARRAPGGPLGLAEQPSNAQGAARTHDLWLIPRADPGDLGGALARTQAAINPPLLQADPVWLTSTEAIGWEMHSRDVELFPGQEEVVEAYWRQLEASRASRNFNGFIDWGRHLTIRGLGNFFRLSRLVDYGLRTHVWGLYARSGERSYYNYAHGFNRFAGDLEMANYDTPVKFKGGFTSGTDISLPHYWGDRTTLISGVTGDDIGNWMLEYYLTGDAYAADRIDMQAEAFLRHWGQQVDNIPELIRRGDGGFAYVRRLIRLYEWTWDETFANWARDWVVHLIDFDVPNAITDSIRHGPLYKTDRNLFYLSYYYRVTGDETARRATLQALDYKYRFWRFRRAFAGQAYPAMLYALGYRWSGNPNYLRVVDYTMRDGLERPLDSSANIHNNMHPTMALPAALALLAEIDEPIEPFPVATCFHELDGSSLLVRVAEDRQPVFLRCAFTMDKAYQEPQITLQGWQAGRPGAAVDDGMQINREFAFQPSAGNRADPRSWHVEITFAESLPAGLYRMVFPGAARVDVLESTAPETAVYAPEGFRLLGDCLPDYFRVEPGTETLELFLGVPMTVCRPDGTPALTASPDDLGEQEIAVDGQHGVWSVSAAESGMVRLFNVEPIFSRSPHWLATGAAAAPAPRFKPPTKEMAFVPGPGGQALHLPGAATLEYPRGAPDGSQYAQYPGETGTVEFWFRPNWSATDLPLPGGLGFNDRHFLRSESQVLQYRRGRDRSGEVASLNLWAYGKDSNAGFTGRFWFDAGAWYHLAFIWRTFDGEPGTDGQYAVYVNGEPLAPDPARPGGNHGTAHYWPGRVNGALPFFRHEADEQIVIGPVNGTLAQLRISDNIRYSGSFTPQEALPAPDRHTLAQFALDGDFNGVDGGGRVLVLTPPSSSRRR